MFGPCALTSRVYVMQLLGAGLFMFVTALYLYPFRVETQGVCLIPAGISLLFFLFAILEAHNMTDRKIDKDLAGLKKSIAEAKAKLKLTD